MKKLALLLFLTCLICCACEPEDIELNGDAVMLTFSAVKKNEPPLKLSLINRCLPQYYSQSAYDSASDGTGRKVVLATIETDCEACKYLAVDIDKLAGKYRDKNIDFAILFFENEDMKETLGLSPWIQDLQNVSAYYNSKEYPIEDRCRMGVKAVPGVRFINEGVVWYRGYSGWYADNSFPNVQNKEEHEKSIRRLTELIDEFVGM